MSIRLLTLTALWAFLSTPPASANPLLGEAVGGKAIEIRTEAESVALPSPIQRLTKFSLIPSDWKAETPGGPPKGYTLLDFARLLGRQTGWWDRSSPLRVGLNLSSPTGWTNSEVRSLKGALEPIESFSIRYRLEEGSSLGFRYGRIEGDETDGKLESYFRWELGLSF